MSDEFLREIAADYRGAERVGEPRYAAVCRGLAERRKYEESMNNVKRWIRLARQRGLLTTPPTRTGVKRPVNG